MKKALLYSLAAVALVSCSSDDQGESGSALQEARITAGVTGVATRALGATWEADHIGIIVTSAPNSTMDDTYTNVEYQTSASTATSADFTAVGQKIFFQDATETVTFAAYAPYNSSITAANRIITASTEHQQSTTNAASRTEQQKIDFIHASEATASNSSPEVSFNSTTGHPFTHKMTRLVLVMKTDAKSGFSANDVTSGTYTLEGITHDGTFNVLTGVAQATDPGSSAAWSLNDNTLKEVATDNSSITFTSILFPQTVSSLTLNATIGGQTYKATLTPALASGMSYTYTVTMKKQGLTVSGCTIEDWGSGNGTSGEEISGTIPVTYNVSNLTSGSTITLIPGSTVTLSGASSSSSNAKTRAANTTPIDLTLVFEGSAKLILDNVALEGSDTRIVVKHGTANIILKGDNSISLTYSTSMAKYSSCGPISLLNEDAHVIIDGEDKDANCLTISSELERVLIGGIQDNKAGNITIKNAKLKLFPADLSYLSNSIIGNGESDESNVSCGDINILNSALSFTFSSITSELNCSLIGNGFSKKESKCGDINISNSTLVSYCNSEGNISTYAALIGMGLVNDGTSSCGKISITSDLTKDTFISNLNNNGKITQSSIEEQTPEWIGFGIIICSDSDNHNSASHNGIWYNDTQIEAPQTKNGIYYSPEPPMSMVR